MAYTKTPRAVILVLGAPDADGVAPVTNYEIENFYVFDDGISPPIVRRDQSTEEDVATLLRASTDANIREVKRLDEALAAANATVEEATTAATLWSKEVDSLRENLATLTDLANQVVGRNEALSAALADAERRAAEARFCGDISAGASHDIQAATSIARAMVSELGMSDAVGPINYSERQGSEFLGTELMRARSHSEDMAKLIDDEVRKLIDEAYAQAESILAEYNDATEELTRALLLYETVDGQAVQDIVAGAKAEDVAPAPRKDPAPESTQAPTKDKSLDPSKGRKDDLPGNAGFSPA